MKARLFVLGILLVLVAVALAACDLGGAPTATPLVVKQEVTKIVEKPITQIVEKPITVTVQQPVTVTIQQTAVPQPTAAPAAAKPIAPTVELQIVPVAANPTADPNVLTATISIISDTKVGPYKTVIGTGASGLNNVSIGVPVTVQSVDVDAKNPSKKWAWTLAAPPGSKATLAFTNTVKNKFTPDIPGMYFAVVTASNDAGSGEAEGVQVHADTYIGMDQGSCKSCHPTKVAEWTKTGHGIIFTRELAGGADPATSHYSESCIRCHTTGYYYDASGKPVANGGFADVQAQTKWAFPVLTDIQTKGAANYAAVPAALKNMANVQCEACHGPAADHVKNGAPTMAGSIDEGVCNVCHNGGGHHIKGDYFKNAAHSDETAMAWTYPVGAAEQGCVRCHSGEGFITFTENPTNQAAWNTSQSTLTCTSCHDPHSDANPKQLRIVGKPVQTPVDLPDMGLSAICAECHNGRRAPADALKGSFPHYSAAAEMVYNLAGVDYGQTLTNSPHGQMVGVAPMPDPADSTGKTLLYGGNKPGACVTCHMQPGLADTKDANYTKVGEHSFNMVSPDGKFDYAAVCASCHGKITDFNLKAKADYDGNGKVEGVQDEVKGLLNLLLAEFDKAGVKKTDSNPYFTNTATMNDKQKNAMYNFRVIYGVMWTGEGKAAAIHNFKRSVELLQLSYKDLTGKDVPGATLMK
jgi:hypothetical protein